MRMLYINSTLVDIDEQTSIGIDYQAYDLKEPGKGKVKISNTFTIPKTAHNLSVFGNPDNPQSQTTVIYDKITCDYWIDNYQIISSGATRVESIDKTRISLYVASKNDIWDDLKSVSWATFQSEYLTWLETVKGIDIHYDGSDFETFITPFVNATEDIVLPFYYGNRLAADEDLTNIHLGINYIELIFDWFLKGGHFCIFSKSIFEFIEYKFSVNFCVSESSITGNIFDDAIAPTTYTTARDICVKATTDGSPLEVIKYELVFSDNNTTNFTKFSPLDDVFDKQDKTLFDFVKAFMQKFNCFAEDITLTDGTKAILLARFDDIKTLAPVVDFSKNISSVETFKNTVEGYAQHNYIKYKGKYPEASDIIGARDIVTLNKNAEYKKDILEIDEYYPSFKAITDAIIPDLSIQESFKSFQFFVTNGVSTDSITITAGFMQNTIFGYVDLTKTATLNLQIPAIYGLSTEYLFIEEILERPKVYTIKKWLSLNDIYDLKFFAQYWVRQLNGSYYINKISGFNPQKSKEPTTIELIRISDKTPTPSFDTTDYYTDDDEVFTDGLGNYFY